MKKSLSKFLSIVLLIIFCSSFFTGITYAYDRPYDGINTVSRNFAIKNDGTLWGWGTNELGQIGNGSTKTQKTPVNIMSNVISVYQNQSLYRYTFALKKDGSLWSWGSNLYGQLGNGGKGNAKDSDGGIIQTKPAKVMDNVLKVFIENYITAVIKKDGSLWICGQALNLVNKKFNDKSAQTIFVKVLDNVSTIDLSDKTCIALKKDGTLWFWGYDEYSLFNRGTADTLIKKPLKIMDNVASVKTNMESELLIAILKKDGTLWTIGLNEFGEVGNGNIKIQKKPVKILDNVTKYYVYKSALSPCMAAIRKDGSLWMWGSNSSYAIGNGGRGDAKDVGGEITQTKPVKILDNVQAVNIGEEGQVLALKNDKSLWVWGMSTCIYDNSEQSVTGEYWYYQSTPFQLLENVNSIDNFDGTSVVIKEDKSLWSWGRNMYGTVGNGTLYNQCEPLKLLENVQYVLGEISAIQSNGTLWRWGVCADYSLGTGSIGTDKVYWAGAAGVDSGVNVQNVPVSVMNDVYITNK